MAYAKKEDQRQAWRNHYARNTDKYRDRNTKRRSELRVWLDDLKSVPCIDCGNVYPPYVMDWHHSEGLKEFNVGSAINKMFGKARILKEIEKCVLLCSNCHRIRTYSG